MISTKKALMLSFVVTILFSILLFGSAIGFGAKLLRLSGQANDNFDSLYQEINRVADEEKEGFPHGFMLIIDDNTFVAGMKKGSSIELKFGLTTLVNCFSFDLSKGCVSELKTYNYVYPKECQEKDCLILCRDLALPDISSDNKEVTCKNVRFKQINQELKESFIFLRYQNGESSYRLIDYGQNGRRIPIKITKLPESIISVGSSSNAYWLEAIDNPELKSTLYSVNTPDLSLNKMDKGELILEIVPQKQMSINLLNAPHQLNVPALPQLSLTEKKLSAQAGQVDKLQNDLLRFVVPIEAKESGEYEVEAKVDFYLDSPGKSTSRFNDIAIKWKVVVK